MRVTFFCFAKRKSPKKRRPPVCDPFAALRGDLRRGGYGVRRRTHCAPLALRSNNCGELDHEAGVSFGTHATPQPPRRRRSQQGVGQPNNRITEHQTTSRAIASLGLAGVSATRCATGPSGAQRSNGPCGCPIPWVPFRMRRGARRPADQGSRLSERSEFERDPAGREHRRLPHTPARACGDAACRVAFSLVTFFWRSKRKPLRRRAHTPASSRSPRTQPTMTNCIPDVRMSGCPDVRMSGCPDVPLPGCHHPHPQLSNK